MPHAPRRSHTHHRFHRTAAIRVAAAGLLALLLLPAAAPAVAETDSPNTCAAAAALPTGTWHAESLRSSTDIDWFQFSTSTTVRALITLGGLAPDANDRLDLYSSCGTLLASSNRPDNEYEELYRALPPGTFHLRVQRAAGPTSTDPYALRVKLLSYTVQVLSSSGWLEFPNKPRIAGEVLNNTATPREDIGVRIRFYDAADNLIRTGDTYARFERLPAWSRSMFVWSAVTVLNYDHYTVQVLEAPVASDQPFTSLRATLGAIGADLGVRYFQGTLQNPTDRVVGVPRVMLTLYDAYGRVRNADFMDTSPDPMAPHSERSFEIPLNDHWDFNRFVLSSHGYPQ